MSRITMIRVAVASVLGVGAVLAFMFIRSRGLGRGMMGGGSSGPAGGLVAVSAKGTPLPAAAGAPANVATQTVGNLKVSLALSPYPPAGFQTSTFEVTLVDANQQAVTDAAISLDLTMPAMPMPTNVVTAAHTSNGIYRGAGRFTMRGLWRMEVIIERGGEKQSAFFDVSL
jgi:hypothetical protein